MVGVATGGVVVGAVPICLGTAVAVVVLASCPPLQAAIANNKINRTIDRKVKVILILISLLRDKKGSSPHG